MQTFIVYLMLLLGASVMSAQNSIEVSLMEFDNNDGTVEVGLYNQEGEFLERTYKALSSEIKEKKAIVTFNNIPDGIYAISCYHDKNGDGKLNMFMNIMPSEPYGTSNNARGFFGPPKWEDARFEVKQGEIKQLSIKM